jgi:hypothetical protein
LAGADVGCDETVVALRTRQAVRPSEPAAASEAAKNWRRDINFVLRIGTLLFDLCIFVDICEASVNFYC